MIAKFTGRWQKNEQEMPLLTEKLSNHQNIWSLSIVSKFPPLLAIVPNKKTQKENAMGMVLLLLFLYFLYKKIKESALIILNHGYMIIFPIHLTKF